MTRQSSIAAVAATAGITHAQAKKAIKAAFDLVLTDTYAGEKISVHGFGTFEMKDVKARKGVNPQTGKPIEIAAKRTLRFKFSKSAEDKINEK